MLKPYERLDIKVPVESYLEGECEDHSKQWSKVNESHHHLVYKGDWEKSKIVQNE